MVRRAESYVSNKRLLLKKEGWSEKEFLREGNASVDFKNPQDRAFIQAHNKYNNDLSA
jgi:hypothetical protein